MTKTRRAHLDRTFLIGHAAVVNARPLVALKADPEDVRQLAELRRALARRDGRTPTKSDALRFAIRTAVAALTEAAKSDPKAGR